MVIKHILKKETYFDSVTLMLINNEIKKMDGVTNSVVGMGTDYNIESLKRLNLFVIDLHSATPNDLIICVEAINDDSARKSIEKAEELLIEKKKRVHESSDYVPASQESASKFLPGANIVIISVPGQYAKREAKIALEAGRHVMLFSDNVTIDEELELKELAITKGLLVMGPDCGTAIINGVPLAFANSVRRGDIGIVAASGTGLQEVSCIIHKLGCGISQAIGVGGRDLKEKIQGRMTIQAVTALASDPRTKVIIIISKPPEETTYLKLLGTLKFINKPIVIYFIGADPGIIKQHGFIAASNLEDTAIKACELSLNKTFQPLLSDSKLENLLKASNYPALQTTYLRGLYSGGTLCDEAQRLLLADLKEIYSNTPVPGCKNLANVYQSEKHTIIDLGDDEFTRGRAHPMIDPEYRKERIITESRDEKVGMIIFDVVLGYGSHPDMASEMITAIKQAKKSAKTQIIFACNICGTDEDIQDYNKQKQILESENVFVFSSHLSLIKFVKQILLKK
ncbi:MAG: acyl-CoA synthetase FdrA [Candidatus Hydrogenedentota bacterium]